MTKQEKTRGRPKDEDKAAAILEAASRQFIEKGMQRTNMQEIANEAGVSKYTVYNHFGSKEELFQRIIHNKCTTNMGESMLERALAQEPEEGLYTLGMGFIGIIYNDEAVAMHRTVMSESRNGGDIAKLFYETGPERVFGLLRTYFVHLEAKGICRFEDIQRAAEIFVSFFTGPLHMKTVLKIQAKPTQKQLEAFTRENVSFFLRIFGTHQ